MTRAAIVAIAVMLVAPARPATSERDQWSQFRGPRAGVAADDPALPERWSETENVVWRIDVPGLGWSSPVVWDDHIFLTSAVSSGQEATPIKGVFDPGDAQGSLRSTNAHRWIVYDVDFKTGAVRWQRELHGGAPPTARHIKNSFASETAVTDGECVYVYFGSIGLVAALTLSGEVVWSQHVGAFPNFGGFGAAASPTLYKDRLIVVNDNMTRSAIHVFDAKTGKELWKAPREERGNWSTPFVWENERRVEIVTAGTGRIRSYDLDGHLLWEVNGMSELTIPTPFSSHGLLYVGSGYPASPLRPVYAIRPGASGDISLTGDQSANDFIAWRQPLLGTYNTSALVYGDYYYTLLDRGFLLCHDARTGRQIYGRQRISSDSSAFTSSPWAYNGKLFLLSEDGDTFVVQAGPEYKLLGRNSLNDMTLATPAVVRGSLILRTQSKLYRIAKAPRP
jgi:outer membrane protein assembly factor BamB